MLDLSMHILLNNRADWATFIGCATVEIALKNHGNEEPDYPCLALRIPAQPDWGPGAPDRYQFLTNADAYRLWSALSLEGQLPIPLTPQQHEKTLRLIVNRNPTMTLHVLSMLLKIDRVELLSQMDSETINIIRSR